MSAQVVWKLKHVPTGEYAKAALPEYTSEWSTLYLGGVGKLFVRKPKLPNVPIDYCVKDAEGMYTSVAEVSDWVLEEYHLVLQSTVDG